MPTCRCGSKFFDKSALSQHQRAKSHCFCSHCDRRFKTMTRLEQHNLAIHCWPCGHCNREFSAKEKLAAHQRSTGHCYCEDCERFFGSNDALRQHRNSSIHVSQFHCCDCDRDFATERALEQHLADKVHTVSRRLSRFICQECDREFGDERALEQHLTSLIHRPLSNIKCIAAKCRGRFKSPSALLHHLESGACQSGINRVKLNSLIQTHDSDQLICDPTDDLSIAQAISDSANSTSRSESAGDITLTPSRGSAYSYPASHQAVELSDSLIMVTTRLSLSTNRCPICPPTCRPFHSLQSLKQHLDSAAHAGRIFHCPKSISPSTTGSSTQTKFFSTLSGLAQHLESGACYGGLGTLRATARYVEVRLRQLGWSGKLLSH